MNQVETETVIELDDTRALLSSYSLNEIKDMIVYDEVGNRHSLGELWKEFKTIIIFVRVNLIFYMNLSEISGLHLKFKKFNK